MKRMERQHKNEKYYWMEGRCVKNERKEREWREEEERNDERKGKDEPASIMQ